MVSQVILILASLSALASGLPANLNDCPSGLQRDEYLKVFGNHCYQFETQHQKTFWDAEIHCRVRGGNLAYIKDDTDNKFIKEFLESYGIVEQPIMVGLGFFGPDETFIWSNGMRMSYNKLPRRMMGRCIGISAVKEEWAFLKCKLKQRFVCQFPVRQQQQQQQQQQQEPQRLPADQGDAEPETIISLDDCPSNLKRDESLTMFGDKCYTFNKSPKSWESAVKVCENTGGNLVTIADIEVQEFVHNLLVLKYKLANTRAWIDFSASASQPQKNEDHGKSMGFSFTNFYSDKKVPEDSCVAMDSEGNGKWHAIGRKSCRADNLWARRYPFVCQYAPDE